MPSEHVLVGVPHVHEDQVVILQAVYEEPIGPDAAYAVPLALQLDTMVIEGWRELLSGGEDVDGSFENDDVRTLFPHELDFLSETGRLHHDMHVSVPGTVVLTCPVELGHPLHHPVGLADSTLGGAAEIVLHAILHIGRFFLLPPPDPEHG